MATLDDASRLPGASQRLSQLIDSAGSSVSAVESLALQFHPAVIRWFDEGGQLSKTVAT